MAPAYDYRDPAECAAQIASLEAEAHAHARRHATRVYEVYMRRADRVAALMRRLDWSASPRRKRVGA